MRLSPLMIRIVCLQLLFIAIATDSVFAAEVVYQPSNEAIANPERGFYYQLTARSENRPLRAERLQELREQGITLILRMYYLKPFRDKPLSPVQLDLVKQDFETLRQSGLKCILRFAYSSSIGEPDAPLTSVLQHVEQLEPILRENMDLITVFQTGFIGSWGEMHSSTNGLTEAEPLRAITSRLLQLLPSSRCLCVRTPRLKHICAQSTKPLQLQTAFTDQVASRIGHYNDCFLADRTDVGTYDDEKTDAEKKYLADDTRFVPMGGETCRPSEYAAVDNARREMARMHWTYLHLDYHPKVISTWRSQGFLDEVRNKLGYRLELIKSSCKAVVSLEGSLAFRLELKNNGWAAPINPRNVVLIAKNTVDGNEFRTKLKVDPRRWLPGDPIKIAESVGIPREMPTGDYRLYLSLPDPSPMLAKHPEYAIQLANEGLWDAKTGRHDLSQSITVNDHSSGTDQPATVHFESH